MSKARAIVIGSGISGLAAAVRLQIKGYQTTVFEANDYPGGKLTQFSRDGFVFDAGPSLFTMPHLVDELFVLAGKKPADYFRYKKLDALCHYFFADGTRLIASADAEQFATHAAHATGVDRERVMKHLRKSRYIYNATADLFIGRSLHKAASYLRWDTFVSFLKLPFLHVFETMNGLNQRKLQNGKMAQLFNRFATYNGSDPYQAPGILNIIPHLEHHLGAYYPQGGMYSITKSIYGLACELGVTFRFQTPVTRILIKQGKVQEVVAGGNRYAADVVACNMDVVLAYRKLMPDQPQPEKILKQERSSSALIFYWGIGACFPQLQLHNIFFSADYAEEFNAIFRNGTVSADPTIYINITAKEDPAHAPEGMENWFVMINVPSDAGQDWDQLIAQVRRSVLQKLSCHLNTDIEALIRTEDVLDPRAIASRTQSYKGALYGTSSNNRMAGFFRHPNFSSRVKGLYFCGGSVHPGGGIPLALSSAKIVDGLIQKAPEKRNIS
jgi:diapolycopene oxygenase